MFGFKLLYQNHTQRVQVFKESAVAIYLTDQDLKELMGLPLQSLEISGGVITNEGLKLLRGMPLKSLVLYWCDNITNEGLENLNELPLQKLTLTHCIKLTGQCLENLKRFPFLNSFSLSHCSITKQDLEHLEGLSIKYLTLPPPKDESKNEYKYHATEDEYYSDYSAENEYYDSEYEDAIEDGSFLEESEDVYDVAEAEESEDMHDDATDNDSFVESYLIKEMDLDTPKEKGF